MGVTELMTGALGVPTITVFKLETVDVPAAFIATTRILYAVLLTNPVMVSGNVNPDISIKEEPRVYWYFIIGEPLLFTSSIYTIADLSPGTISFTTGGKGTSNGIKSSE